MSRATRRFPEREVALCGALAAARLAPRRVTHGTFDFGGGDGNGGLGGRATLEDDWVRLRLADAAGASTWSAAGLLELNAGLYGPVGWAWAPTAKRPALLADCWFPDGEAAATAELRAACRSLAAAAASSAGRPAPERASSAVPAAEAAEAATVAEATTAATAATAERDLAHEVNAAGWKCQRRDDGSLAVDLDAGRDYFTAQLCALRGAGRAWLLAHVDLARHDAEDAEAREAPTRLLLGAGAALRLARGATLVADGRRAYRVQVGLPAEATAGELHRALAALAVACATYGPEARALTRPALARVYVAVRGGSRPVGIMHRAPRGAARQGG